MNTPFQPSWESLKTYSIPDWYQDAKFGIFIHWGLYAVPAFGNEWYPRNMYLQGTPEFQHHLETYGPHHQFGYKDFIAQFRAENYDADAWASLFQQAGAKYVVPVAEHHDGFPMYDSAFSEWTAAKMGPKRDLIGELAEATRKRGMVFGVSSHRAEHWWFMNGGRDYESDVNDPRYADFYSPAMPSPKPQFDSQAWQSRDWQPRPDALYLEDWLARCCELVDKYRPQVFWFDWWIEQIVFQPYLQRFAAYFYNHAAEWGQGVAINYKNEAYPEQAAVLDIERGQLNDIRPLFWQTDTSVSKNSWGYVKEQDYKSATDVIGDLVDIVSKNGCLLLNIGPRPDGTIPEPEQAILREIGAWLAVNGESIYNTRPWKIYGEGPTEVAAGAFTDTKRTAYTGQDFRFTRSGSSLYATALSWPGAEAHIRSLTQEQVQSVRLLGLEDQLQWKQDGEGLKVQMPAQRTGQHAYVFKIELAEGQ